VYDGIETKSLYSSELCCAAGEVLLDGYDIKKLDLKWLRGQIGLVNQEPALFATTIGKNILYGKDDATQEEIVAAAKASNAHSFIDQLPQKYDTQVCTWKNWRASRDN
jgi:ATP-binding cassette subfamily B (MDR/TAP) protein 1